MMMMPFICSCINNNQFFAWAPWAVVREDTARFFLDSFVGASSVGLAARLPLASSTADGRRDALLAVACSAGRARCKSQEVITFEGNLICMLLHAGKGAQGGLLTMGQAC